MLIYCSGNTHDQCPLGFIDWTPRAFFAFQSVFPLMPRLSDSLRMTFCSTAPSANISSRNSFASFIFCPRLLPLSRLSALMSYSPIHSNPFSLSNRKAIDFPSGARSFSHGKLLLFPARSSHALRSEHSLPQPESQ